MNKKMIKWLDENGAEIVTFIIESGIIIYVAYTSGKRKAKALIWVGAAELLTCMVRKYFNKFN